MSHIPQRKEKDCLNCGAAVQGRYCHVCGQENVVPKETFWHMVTHFFNDITHFDGSFLTTAKDLLFKPGFLSKEYMKGRRASYLHPVRMYVFTSAIFFLLFFSFFATKDIIKININNAVSAEIRAAYIEQLEEKLQKDTGNVLLKERLLFARDSTHPLSAMDIVFTENNNGISNIGFNDKRLTAFEEYDSAQKILPASQRDNWIERRLVRMGINVRSKFRENPEEATKKLVNIVLHRLPYMLLISLPFFALILKLVYIRRRAQFYYADHGVFAIHLYVFSFLLLLLVFSLAALRSATDWEIIDWLVAGLIILLLFYLYKAMRVFYGQGRWKTFFKFLFVALISFIMMLILFALFMFFSAATL